MGDSQVLKYAELLISMSTDLMLGRITREHYCNMVAMVSDKLNAV